MEILVDSCSLTSVISLLQTFKISMYRSDKANTVTGTFKVCITQLHSSLFSIRMNFSNSLEDCQYLSSFNTCNADTHIGGLNPPNIIGTLTDCQARSLLTESLPY